MSMKERKRGPNPHETRSRIPRLTHYDLETLCMCLGDMPWSGFTLDRRTSACILVRERIVSQDTATHEFSLTENGRDVIMRLNGLEWEAP